MKSFYTYILLALYGVALLRPLAPIVDYSINKDYIATVLCINKDKPELKCNGKCHLNNELKKTSDQQEGTSVTINLEDYPIGFVNLIDLDFEIEILDVKQLFNFVNIYEFQFLNSIFHPPTF